MKRFLLKPCVILLAMGLLSACQSVESPAKKTLSASEAFAGYQKSQDAQAKLMLIDALKAHLGSDRVSVSNYYYNMQGKKSDSLNDGADPLMISILKLWEYNGNDEEVQAYRTMHEYLDDESAPYLRYYDETEETSVQDTSLTRLVALNAIHKYHRELVDVLSDDQQACISANSYRVDRLLTANPKITDNDKALKKTITELDDCLDKANKKSALKDYDLAHYQKDDVKIINHCASQYRHNLSAALSSGRTQKTYQGKDFDAYQSVYGSYRVCMVGYEMNYRLDPNHYIENALSKERLELLAQVRQCSFNHRANEEQLVATNVSYRSDAKAFENNFYQYFTCINKAAKPLFEKAYDGAVIETPTSMDEAWRQYQLFSERVYKESTEETMGYESRALGWLDNYFKIKQDERNKKEDDKADSALSEPSYADFGKMSYWFNAIKKTPEEISAKNYYAYNPSVITILSRHRPSAYLYEGVMAFDYESATASQSFVVPLRADFLNESLKVNVGAFLPLSVMADPYSAPRLQDYHDKGASVGLNEFHLPEPLSDIIPASLVYESVNKGFLAGLDELNALNFSAVSGDDAYAKQFGAKTTIKLNLSTKAMGELFAIISKQLVKDLSAYVEANPERFDGANETAIDSVSEDILAQKRIANTKRIKGLIEKWALLDKGFVSADVGGAMQIIEALLPIRVEAVNYYYLDNQGKLVGQVVVQETDALMTSSTTQMLGLTSFDKKAFDRHRLSSMFIDANVKAVDGNAMIKALIDAHNLQQEAENVRAGYAEADEASTEELIEALTKELDTDGASDQSPSTP